MKEIDTARVLTVGSSQGCRGKPTAGVAIAGGRAGQGCPRIGRTSTGSRSSRRRASRKVRSLRTQTRDTQTRDTQTREETVVA